MSSNTNNALYNDQTNISENLTGVSNTIEELSKTQKTSVIKKGWVRVLLVIVLTSIFSSIAVIPLFVLGFFSLEMMEIPFNELFNTVGVNMMLLFSLLQFIGVLFTLVIFRKFIDKKSFTSLGFELSGHKKDLLKGLVWGTGLISCGFLVLYLGDYITITDVNFSAISWLSYLALFAVIAFNEEILVRGYVLTNLMASMNKYWALVVSALIFSAMHLGNDNTSWLSIINLFLAGIMLGIYTIHKRNLWFPIAMHFTWNLVQGPILGFEVSGLQVESVINQKVTGSTLITGGEFGFEGSLLLSIMMIVSTVYLHLKYKECDKK